MVANYFRLTSLPLINLCKISESVKVFSRRFFSQKLLRVIRAIRGLIITAPETAAPPASQIRRYARGSSRRAHQTRNRSETYL